MGMFTPIERTTRSDASRFFVRLLRKYSLLEITDPCDGIICSQRTAETGLSSWTNETKRKSSMKIFV